MSSCWKQKLILAKCMRSCRRARAVVRAVVKVEVERSMLASLAMALVRNRKSKCGPNGDPGKVWLFKVTETETEPPAVTMYVEIEYVAECCPFAT